MIDLRVAGDAAGCRSSGSDIKALADSIDDATTELASCVRESRGTWQGAAGDSFREGVGNLRTDADGVVDRVRTVGRALDQLADDIVAVRAQMDGARTRAAHGGLRTTPDAIYPPTPIATPVPPGGRPLADPSTGQFDPTPTLQVPPAQAMAWAQAIIDVKAARTEETAAHHRFREQLSKANDDAWWIDSARFVGALPTEHANPFALVRWAAAFGTSLAEGGAWAVITRRLRWDFRGANGQFIDRTIWNLSRVAQDTRRWLPHPGQIASAGDDLAKLGARLAGRIAAPLAGAVSGWDQWDKDSDNPALSDAERTGRTAIRGTAVAAGALGGAAAGAAVGSVVPVVGTAIGGVVGGLVGGIVGSGIMDGVTDKVLNEGQDVGNALLDTVTFWD